MLHENVQKKITPTPWKAIFLYTFPSDILYSTRTTRTTNLLTWSLYQIYKSIAILKRMAIYR